MKLYKIYVSIPSVFSICTLGIFEQSKSTMSSLNSCWLSVFFWMHVYSKEHIKPASFGIVTSDGYLPDAVPITTMTLHWHQSSYQCNIEPSTASRVYQCDIIDTEQGTSDGNYLLEIESTHDISIKSVIILDDNGDSHELNAFCLKNNCQDTITTTNIAIEFAMEISSVSSPQIGILKDRESIHNPYS